MFQGIVSNGFTRTIRATLGVDNAEYGDLRLSPKVVSIALVMAGLLLLPLADQAPQRLHVLLFALVLDTLAVGIWLATDWRLNVGRWCAVGSVTLLIPIAATWFAASGLLVSYKRRLRAPGGVACTGFRVSIAPCKALFTA